MEKIHVVLILILYDYKKYKENSKLGRSFTKSTCLHENRHAYNNFPGKKVGKVYGNDFILASRAFALLHDSLNLPSTPAQCLP